MIERDQDVEQFERHREELVGHAYRMLGDLGRAQDMVQDAWLRWSGRSVVVDEPRPYLFKTITRLCLNELDSARARRERNRLDELPEPVDFGGDALAALGVAEQVSMAFMVVLQRLNPAERAVLLLREIFGFRHAEISDLLGKSDAACRKLLSRARAELASERRSLVASAESQRRLLEGFIAATTTGDVDRLADLLVEDVELIIDAGPDGKSFGGARNLPGPLMGRDKVVAFLCAVTPGGSGGLEISERELNGEPSVVAWRDGEPFAAIFIAIAGGRIGKIFIQADGDKLEGLSR